MENKSRIVAFLLISITLGMMFSCQVESKSDIENEVLTKYVDSFIGTDGPGNTYPGAVVPFGMVQLSPDNGLPGWDRIAGYFWPDSTIAGFSHKHLTGTGAGDLYDILIMPYNSRFTENLIESDTEYRPYSMFSHSQELAKPGYYSVDLLSSGIKAELTVTPRVGMHRYTFPEDEDSKILVDLGYSLNWDDPTETYLELVDETTIVGYRYSTGWAPDQREHFVINTSLPIKNIDFYENTLKVEKKSAKAKKTKLEITFNTKADEQVLLKVALSSHSIEAAQKNMEAECPAWDFDAIVKQADEAWNKQLSSISIEASEYQKKLFYTNLYHCFLTPSLHADVDGWYKGADGEMHQAVGYDKYDTFSLWDTYRTAHPLYTILVPDKVSDMVASFMSHYKETGLLPVWTMAGNETDMMIGYHAVPVIVDAYFKGISMDAEMAYDACKQTAMSDAWSLPDYKKYGYIPSDDDSHGHWSVSKTLEYAYDDWCIAVFAKALGHEEDYLFFKDRADNWKNLLDPVTTFFRPKDKAGKFIKDFVPRDYSELFCESNAWQYMWHVQHDIEGLIDEVNKDVFVAKLDSMFTYKGETDDVLPIFSTGMIGQYAHGNEPSHHVAYLYNQLGQPHKTQDLVRQILNEQYTDKPDGYCGNEDCGQMSAWYIMSSLGMYPINPADGIYALTSPLHKEATIHLSNGLEFKVSTDLNGKDNVYIQSVTFNDKPLDELTITHQQVMEGGNLHFVLGDTY
ncbi:GH92 family glycosyl hydrolase [Carboxylicivirga sp. N1Y90]|uniref:GH92 family glycosyl hydrolase n=1 Tax=Carboxylicivirga fragile TaxID=3417571 RepID=UPI003D334CEB|nr:GH92 family glycosyl hydrolase [Marinilabiliaceae bacterium N1Y90]